MATSSARVTVGTTATRLDNQPVANDAVAGERLHLQAPSTNTASIFIGGPGVTTANGYELAAGKELVLVLDSEDQVFGVVAAATQPANALRTGA